MLKFIVIVIVIITVFRILKSILIVRIQTNMKQAQEEIQRRKEAAEAMNRKPGSVTIEKLKEGDQSSGYVDYEEIK
jgi:hypothetical protein